MYNVKDLLELPVNEKYVANQVKRKVVNYVNKDLGLNLNFENIRLRERSGKICIKLGKIYREKAIKA